MFSSCCRCVNKKALKEQVSENDDEPVLSSVSPKETSVNGDNGFQATTTTTTEEPIDTTLMVIIEENDVKEEDEEVEEEEAEQVENASPSPPLEPVTSNGYVEVIAEQLSTETNSESENSLKINDTMTDEEKQKLIDGVKCQEDDDDDAKETTTVETTDDNLSGNSNENTETSDNTVRELELNDDNEICTGAKRIDSTESANSNATIEETILLLLDKNANHHHHHHQPQQQQQHQSTTEDDEENTTATITLCVNDCKAPPNSFETSDTLDDGDAELFEYVITYEEDESETLQRRGSCLSRGGSKTSIKKKVNLNDSAEIIPPPPPLEQQSMDEDDEVFSDSIPPKLPRGDMCTPFVTKRGSIPGLAALPDWFREENRELGGILEPPTTPIGRDEVALRRHRFFSDLISAAKAATEHRVCFDPLGPFVTEVMPVEVLAGDCDPLQKQSTNTELEGLVNRLERLVDRLERTVSARELEYTNQLLAATHLAATEAVHALGAQQRRPDAPILQRGTTIEEDTLKSLSYNNSLSDNLLLPDRSSTTDLPTVLPDAANTASVADSSSSSTSLKQRICKLEDSINHQINRTDDDLISSGCQIPTVVENMSVFAYQDIVSGPLATFLTCSTKIGGDVATQADFVRKAFDAQLQFVTMATEAGKPSDADLPRLLQPTSEQINNIQTFREKNRTSTFFNHLSAISESIPALGWVCVSPTPGPHVKEMNDAGQFYTNRVLKDWKEKNPTHVEWCRSWIQTLTELQAYIKQYHTTGLVWSGKGAAKPAAGGIPPPPSGPMPPPPPPIGDLNISNGASGGDDRSALFAEINKGADITKSLKKVTSDMQTHKNPNLRSGPAPYKAPQPFKPATGPKPFAASAAVAAPQADDKAPVFNRDGKKWIIEYQKNNPNLIVENAEMNNVVYMFKCVGSTLQVKGKINSVFMDSCKKCSVVFDSLVSSVEFVNCQSMQMQVLGKVPTISIDKTDGCQMYLSKDSLGVEIISSKSSEMNVMIPQANGDYAEQPVPEQFKTTVKGTSLNTTFVESLG